jgi:hypothetical protein
MSNVLDNQNVKIGGGILVVIIIVLLCIKYCKTMAESFDSSSNPSAYQAGPTVNPRVGALMDGPGDAGMGGNSVKGITQDSLSIIPSNYYFLDDGAAGTQSIQHNLCSKSCCSPSWPTPFSQKYDPFVCSEKNKFVPTNIMCNNSFQDSGCACITKDQALFMANRGGNGRELF